MATALAVLHGGAIPIFVDVDREHGPHRRPAAASRDHAETRAIMPVHVHGCPADLDALIEIARGIDLAIVEDAAQAHGATYQGTAVGAIGTAGGFSLQSSKNLSAGEGGLFVTNDDAIADSAHACGASVKTCRSGRAEGSTPRVRSTATARSMRSRSAGCTAATR